MYGGCCFSDICLMLNNELHRKKLAGAIFGEKETRVKRRVTIKRKSVLRTVTAVILLVRSKAVILQTRLRNCESTKYHFSKGFRGFVVSKLPAKLTRRPKNELFSSIHCNKPLNPSSSTKNDICRRKTYRHESLAANSSSLARRTMSFCMT